MRPIKGIVTEPGRIRLENGILIPNDPNFPIGCKVSIFYDFTTNKIRSIRKEVVEKEDILKEDWMEESWEIEEQIDWDTTKLFF